MSLHVRNAQSECVLQACSGDRPQAVRHRPVKRHAMHGSGSRWRLTARSSHLSAAALQLGQQFSVRAGRHTHRSRREGKAPLACQDAGKRPLRPRLLSASFWRLGKPRAQLLGSPPAWGSAAAAGPAVAAAGAVAAAAAAAVPAAGPAKLLLGRTPAAGLGLGADTISLVSCGKPWDQLAGNGRPTAIWMVSVWSDGHTPSLPQLSGSCSGGCCCSA